MTGDDEGRQDSETVSAPHRDTAPPTRTKQPVIWLTVLLIVLLAMTAALFWAAMQRA